MANITTSKISARAGELPIAPALIEGHVPPPSSTALAHKHPSPIVERILGHSDEGRRIIAPVQGRTATYIFSCKACQAEDKERMAGPALTEEQLANTMFLVPEDTYDQSVCKAYLEKRFGSLDTLHIVPQFNAEKLSYVKGSQIVVVTRRGLNNKSPGPSGKRIKDAEDKWVEIKIDPSEYLHEVVESSPVIVSECIEETTATMFTDRSTDMTELVARLAERAAPPHRIAVPADPRDKLYVMRLNT